MKHRTNAALTCETPMPEAKLHKITLHLAREKAHPEGSARCGYFITAPLDADGRIDLEAWREQQPLCFVERFWDDEAPQRGRLVRRAGGPGGASWGFDYDIGTHADDEAGFRFGDHRFIKGEYVSVRDTDGDLRTFRIVAVAPA